MTSHSTLAAFRTRTFAELWTGSTISNIGGQLQMVGAAWMMTSMTASPQMVSLVQTAASLPVVLGSLFAGVLADSYDRRRLMIGAQSFMFAASILLVAAGWMQLLSPWVLLAFTFLIGCGTALHHPSWHSTIGHVVHPEHMASAISLNAMGQNVTRAVGPATGGLLVGQFGAVSAFIVNALTYPIFIWSLWRWRPEVKPRKLPREPFGSALATGLRFFVLSPKILNPASRAFIFAFAAIPVQSLLPLFAREQLQGGPLLYGLMLTCFGVGAVIAALLNQSLRARLSSEAICRIGFTCCTFASIALALSTSVALSALACFVSGYFWLALFSMMNVTVQVSAPKWVIGRVMSIYLLGIYAGMSGGAWFWGALAGRIGYPQALIASAGVIVLCGLWGLRFPLPPILRQDHEPVDFGLAAPLPDELPGHAGPLVIEITYDIPDPHAPEFLILMRHRRSMRLMEGARHWQLDRDLDHKGRWIESFRFSTWLDYLRHRERRTIEDRRIFERLQTLHQGEGRPRVRRRLKTPPPVPPHEHAPSSAGA